MRPIARSHWISSISNWAAKRDGVAFADNPAKGFERNPERKRERFLTREEFGKLGDAWRETESTGLPWTLDEAAPTSKHTPMQGRRTVIDPHAAGAIRLLILTGARLREILDAECSHVELERGIIHLRARTPQTTTFCRLPPYTPRGALKGRLRASEGV